MKQVRLFSVAIAAFLISWSQAGVAEPIGARYFGQVVPTNATTTIFTAASNVNGATIRTLSANATNGTQLFVNATYPDGTSRVIMFIFSWTGVAPTTALPYPIELPANVGLTVTLSGGNLAGQLYTTYDFK